MGEPCALLALMLTVTVPLTVMPVAGLVIEAASAGGGGGAPPHVAPEVTTGVVASLLIVTAGDRPQLPAASIATACT